MGNISRKGGKRDRDIDRITGHRKGRRAGDACDLLSACQPHMLLLGGDFVSVRAAYIDRLASFLANIPAPYGKFD